MEAQVSLLPDYDIKSLLRKYSVTPKKEKGQSFLKSKRIARQIIDSAEISSEDHVLEIGGGLGILTSLLADTAKHVTVIELETGLFKALQDILADRDNVSVVHGDALKLTISDVDKIVANLPYSISSEIIFKLLTEVKFDLGVLMFQKEFSDRLLATPGSPEYSRLSIDFQYLGCAERIMDVAARNFYPMPAVDSTVLKITKRNTGPTAKNQEAFFWMVHGIYSYPNKQLRKAVKIWFKNIGKPDAAEKFFSSTPFVDDKSRLRTLSLDVLVRLSDVVNNMIESGDIPGPKEDLQ